MTKLAVSTTDVIHLEAAKQLAKHLNLPFIAKPLGDEANCYDFILVYTPNYLGLQQTCDKKFQPFYMDFNSGKLSYRRDNASLKQEMIARAMGFKPKDQGRIVDATAGLGRDAFILASLGFHVTMIEQSPIIAALLEDALNRASKIQQLADIVANLTLIKGDSINWLPEHSGEYDVIYLDPMFPQRQKAASIKKDMQILQNLLPTCNNYQDLFKVAMTCAKKRVVIKRPRLAPNFCELAANFSLKGKSSRFDIYLINNR